MGEKIHWLLLGVIASAVVTCHAESCHVQPECSCSKTDRSYISCYSLCGPYLPKFASSTVQFNQLAVSGSREMTTIRDGTFGELKVKTLKITSSGIERIGCEAFSGLDLRLEDIRLYDNYLSSVPNCSLAQFEYITYLDLSQNRITSILSDSFVSFTLLQTLDLRQNRIASIKQGAFHGLGKLTTVYLYRNELVHLDASTFVGAGSLTRLELQYNNISSVHVRAFDGLGKLERLYINNNNLRHLDNTVFHTTSELKYLNMDNNSLRELGKTLFSRSKMLSNLYARNNKINRILDATFTGLDKLQTLYLDNNWLKDVRQQWFKDTISLRTLSLSRNNITRVNKDTFIHCTNIYNIDLSFNAIEDVQQGSFRNLSQLQYLDFSGNRITQIISGTFFNVTRLNRLRLNDNRVSFISDRWLMNTEPSLSTLELRNNGWSTKSWLWLEKVLVNLTRLNTLDLSNNPLSTIPADLLPVLENIDTVKMRNCSLQYVTNESVSILNYRWDVSENMISTYTSIQAANRYFWNVNISHNLIPELNVDVFEAHRHASIVADNNKIQNSFTLTLLGPYIDGLYISLRNNLIEKGIQISVSVETLDAITIQALDLSANKFTQVNVFPIKTLGEFSWDPCNSSDFNGIWLNTLNLSNNAISSVSADACLGSVYTLDLRNNRLEVLGDFMTSTKAAGFRLNTLYLSGNRIHRISAEVFEGVAKNDYFNLDLRDNRLVGLENIRPIVEKFQSLKLSLSGNPLVCGCEMDWLRNDSVRPKLGPIRCQAPRSAFRYLAWCFPLTGCQDTIPMRFTEATRKICDMDENVEVSDLSVTAFKGVSNVTWTKSGPGVIKGFRLEFHPVDDVESGNSLLIHHDVNYALVTNLVESRVYNICLTAELGSTSGISTVCIQTSLPLAEAFSAGLPVVAGLGSALGVCVIITLCTIICLTCRLSKPNFFHRNKPPVSKPPAVAEISGRTLNAYTPNPEHHVEESDESLYEDVKHEEYENTGFNAP